MARNFATVFCLILQRYPILTIGKDTFNTWITVETVTISSPASTDQPSFPDPAGKAKDTPGGLISLFRMSFGFHNLTDINSYITVDSISL